MTVPVIESNPKIHSNMLFFFYKGNTNINKGKQTNIKQN